MSGFRLSRIVIQWVLDKCWTRSYQDLCFYLKKNNSAILIFFCEIRSKQMEIPGACFTKCNMIHNKLLTLPWETYASARMGRLDRSGEQRVSHLCSFRYFGSPWMALICIMPLIHKKTGIIFFKYPLCPTTEKLLNLNIIVKVFK